MEHTGALRNKFIQYFICLWAKNVLSPSYYLHCPNYSLCTRLSSIESQPKKGVAVVVVVVVVFFVVGLVGGGVVVGVVVGAVVFFLAQLMGSLKMSKIVFLDSKFT